MAQKFTDLTGGIYVLNVLQGPAHNSGAISNLDVDALETVATIDVANAAILYIQFTVAVASLTDFNVDYRADATGSYFTVASVAGDYTTPNAPVLKASGDLTAAAAGTHWLKLDVEGIESVRIQASGTSSTIVGSWGSN